MLLRARTNTLAETARDVGAARVGRVAPYLPYTRPEQRLHDGEALRPPRSPVCCPARSTGW